MIDRTLPKQPRSGLLEVCANNNEISRKCHNNRLQPTRATEKWCYSGVVKTRNETSRKCYNNRLQHTQATEKWCYSGVMKTIMELSRKCYNNRLQHTQATEKWCHSRVLKTIMKYPESAKIVDCNLTKLPRIGFT